LTLHYHGTPITPDRVLRELAGRCFCVRFGCHRQVELCHEIGQSVMLDNGAFSRWTQGTPTDWPAYYRWSARWLEYPTTWAVLPDVIDGTEEQNDALLEEWPFGARGAPVWHMHESLQRLQRLAAGWPRVCIGSSGKYATVGTRAWHDRMAQAMNALCGTGPVPVWLHMLRGMNLAGSEYPFASVDSTDIARNHNRRQNRAVAMADRWDSLQCHPSWRPRGEQLVIDLAERLAPLANSPR
jgi:hypothetical protein